MRPRPGDVCYICINCGKDRNLKHPPPARQLRCPRCGGGYSGTKDISGSYYYIWKCNARQRNYDWHLTIDDLQSLYDRQGGRCALSGWPLKTERRTTDTARNLSLDRIDSNKGYTLDNVQLVANVVNMAKRSLSDADFIALCEAVVAHQTAKAVPS